MRHLTVGVALPPLSGPPVFTWFAAGTSFIYLQPAVQGLVLHLILRSLTPGGYLCLGEAEWPSPSLLPHLEVVDRTARIFRLKPGVELGAR